MIGSRGHLIIYNPYEPIDVRGQQNHVKDLWGIQRSSMKSFKSISKHFSGGQREFCHWLQRDQDFVPIMQPRHVFIKTHYFHYTETYCFKWQRVIFLDYRLEDVVGGVVDQCLVICIAAGLCAVFIQQCSLLCRCQFSRHFPNHLKAAL